MGHCIIRHMPKPKKKRHGADVKTTNHLVWVRALVGPAFVMGGWQIMATSYVAGVTIVYLGFLLCLVECIKEPELVSGPYPLQITLILAVIVLAEVFSVGVVLVRSPIDSTAYVILNSDYRPGINVGQIPWNPHFTDLRVAIINPDDDDYSNVDIAIQPDQWNYKADILNETTGCKLFPMGGNAVLISSNIKGG